jgi:pyridoxal 5'-phosphate synthase pdxS subunit
MGSSPIGVTNSSITVRSPAKSLINSQRLAFWAQKMTNGTCANSNSSFDIKVGLARMLCNGVIMDVIDVEQARIAEDAGAVAVMALERVPSDIRRDGGVARMSDPKMIEEIKAAVSIPVMAKVRIGHIAEAQILEAIGIDFIDESEVLTPADPQLHIDKHEYKTPFVCGAKDLGEALRRIKEGAAMMRTKGEAGTGNIIEAVRHLREINRGISELTTLSDERLAEKAEEFRVPLALVKEVRQSGRLPVPNFAAGGVATPADAALCRMLGAESVFVGSGIFKSENPLKFAKAVVQATCFYNEPGKLLEASRGLGQAMRGIEIGTIPTESKLANRGW